MAIAEGSSTIASAKRNASSPASGTSASLSIPVTHGPRPRPKRLKQSSSTAVPNAGIVGGVADWVAARISP